MTAFLHDGSFEGLLCAFQAALDAHDSTPIFESAVSGQTGWLLDAVAVATNSDVAQNLCNDLARWGGDETLQWVVYTCLSEIGGTEHPLFEFISLTLAQCASVVAWHQHDAVRRVRAASDKVAHEIHRFEGLLRFAKLRDGCLYAPYGPDHNITMPLARHFQRRMPNAQWVIHDKKRDLAVAWDGSALHAVADVSRNVETPLADDELDYQRLWRMFTERIAIGERVNPALQRRFMPERYWAYLPEKRPSPATPLATSYRGATAAD